MQITAYASAHSALLSGGTPGFKVIEVDVTSLSASQRHIIASICDAANEGHPEHAPSLQVKRSMICDDLDASTLTTESFLAFVEKLEQKRFTEMTRLAADQAEAMKKETKRQADKSRIGNEQLASLEAFLATATVDDLIAPASDDRVLSINNDFYLSYTHNVMGYVRMSENFQAAVKHPETPVVHDGVFDRLSPASKSLIFDAIDKENVRRVRAQQLPARIINHLVTTLGTDSQKERHEAGVLPAAEIKELYKQRLLGVLALPRYERITESDVPEPFEHFEGEVKFANTELTELTHDQFQFVKRVKALVPENDHLELADDECVSIIYRFTPKKHSAGYAGNDATEVTRYSLSVTARIPEADIEFTVLLAMGE